MKWQPIETAPTDGTRILLRGRNGKIADGHYGQPDGFANPKRFVWPYINATPTHWAPLALIADAATGRGETSSSMRVKRYPITPCPAPRMTRRDAWAGRPCVQRYFAFRDEVRLHGVTIPDRVRIIFHMPMPASWSAKKRAEMDGQPHQVRPDTDNLWKSVGDSVFDNDAHIWEIHASKIWGVDGAIEIGEID